MAWPPPVLPVNRTDALDQQANHPADHNAANGAINEIVAQLGPLISLGGLSVVRKVFTGTVTTDGNGDFAFNTGYMPTAALGISAQVGFPATIVLNFFDTTQCVFRALGIPTGAPIANATINVSYVVLGPKP